MASIQSSVDLQHSKPEQLSVYVTRFFKQLLTQFNGNIQFKQNLKSSSILTVAFAAVVTDNTISHDLGQTPVGFIVVNSNVAMNIYQGSQAWSATSITLQSTAVGTALIYAI